MRNLNYLWVFVGFAALADIVFLMFGRRSSKSTVPMMRPTMRAPLNTRKREELIKAMQHVQSEIHAEIVWQCLTGLPCG